MSLCVSLSSSCWLLPLKSYMLSSSYLLSWSYPWTWHGLVSEVFHLLVTVSNISTQLVVFFLSLSAGPRFSPLSVWCHMLSLASLAPHLWLVTFCILPVCCLILLVLSASLTLLLFWLLTTVSVVCIICPLVMLSCWVWILICHPFQWIFIGSILLLWMYECTELVNVKSINAWMHVESICI